jgi:hypothetical protein
MTLDRNIRERFTADEEDEISAVRNLSDGAQEGTAPRVKDEQVAILAYSYWQQRGCPDGCPEEDWFRAEKQLASQNGSR